MTITQQLVRAIQSPSSLATPDGPKAVSGVIDDAEAEIELNGFGPLPIPMRPKHVRELESLTTQAPFGKGSQTVVDTNVRNTREIAPGQLALSSSFQQAIEDLLPNIASGLGLPSGELSAELYKLLIYDRGGQFDWHRDAEKKKGMVASLIVVLPSKFGGGLLSLRNSGGRESYNFEKARLESAIEYVAFYADCEHSVSRVESGVRVCLAYNLILKPQREQKATPSTDHEKLVQVMSEWMQSNPADPLVVTLDHQYTDSGLKMNLLKGDDRTLAGALADASNRLGYRFHFGMVSRHLCQYADDGNFGYRRDWRGDYDYDNDYDSIDDADLNIGEVYEDEITIDGWRDARGRTVPLGTMACNDESLISITPIDQWKPTQQDYEGYTGNAGNTLDRWYHKAAIALWPEERHFEMLTRSGVEAAVNELLRMRSELSDLDDDELELACDHCYRLARAIIARWPQRMPSYRGNLDNGPSYLKTIAAEIVRFEDPELASELLQSLALRDWQLPLQSWMPAAIKTFGANDMMPRLIQFLKMMPPVNEYGYAPASGLPLRDAHWLLAICRKRESLGLDVADCASLLDLAVKRFISDVRDEENGYQHDFGQPEKTWLDLVKAASILEYQGAANFPAIESLFAILADPPRALDEREFQAKTCPDLIRWSQQTLGEIAPRIASWRDSLSEWFQTQTAVMPTPPTNQTRPATLVCSCNHCRELATFMADPSATSTTIRARAQIRSHLEHQIQSAQLDLDMRTLRSGTPHGLVVTKNRASYERALQRYKDDLKLLASL